MKATGLFVSLILLGTLLLTSATNAQQGQRGNRVENMVNMLRDSLDLSEDQLTKVGEIITETFEAMAQAREEAQGDRELMRQMMQELYTDMDKQIESLLNDDQKSRYTEIKEQRTQRMRNRIRPNRDSQQ